MISSLLNGHWLPIVINIALQSLFLLIVAAVALVCTRNVSAARRHLISIAALGALLVVPLISLVIPAPQPILQVSGPGLTLRRSPAATLNPSVPTRTTSVAPAASGLPSVSPPVVSVPTPAVIVSPQSASGMAHTTAASVSLSRFAPWLAALWLLGMLRVLGRLLIGFDRIRRITRASVSVLPESLQTETSAILGEAGFTRRLSLVQATPQASVCVAMTWGVRKPTLLLPAEATQWPQERLRVVVLHELAHIRRHDWLTQVFGQIVCALYWFHPLVWLLNRQMQREAERACDDAVLLAGVGPKEYAAHLLEVVKAIQAGRGAPTAAVAMARPKQVHDRLQSILSMQRSRKSPTRSLRTLVLLVTGLLLCAVSLLRPLAWAGAHKQGADRNEIAAIGPVVDLPNGISVEMVGVGASPNGGGDDWWTPNGKPILELPTTGATRFANANDWFAERLLRRTLLFRLHLTQKGDKRVDFSIAGYVVDPTQHLQTDLYHYGRIRNYQSQVLPTRATVGEFAVGFPRTETQCTYRFGVAAGNWETVATTHFSQHPQPDSISVPAAANPETTRIVLDDTPHITYRDARGEEHLLSLLGTHAPLTQVARRIVALDRMGKELFLGFMAEDDKGGSLPLPRWAQAQMVELRLQTCPYQWAEFKDIVLKHPPVRTPSISTPAALAAFRHTFSCGITLTVPAVTEHRKEGGLWWQPDGKPLSGPLKQYEQSVSFQYWGPGTHPRAIALQLTSPRFVQYTFASRFVPTAPDRFEGSPPGLEGGIQKNAPISTWVSGDFAPNLLHTTLRYGIATGAWKAVASIPMPTDARHASENGDPEGDGVLVGVPGYPVKGDMPHLNYRNAAGKQIEIPFQIADKSYLSDVDRRFVAVDRAGHIFPLRSNNYSRMTLDKAGKPIPKDPANAGKPDLLVGDYQQREEDSVFLSFNRSSPIADDRSLDLSNIREFRLEIRPYEWAEFPNIALQPKK